MKTKKILLFSISFLLIFSGIGAFAEDSVEMNDLSTTIKRQGQNVDSLVVPEYKKVEPSDDEALPSVDSKLPDVEKIPDTTQSSQGGVLNPDENHYLEGKVAGGYPGNFLVNFSLLRNSKKNNFGLDFGHESILAYGFMRSSQGFFNHDTDLKLKGDSDLSDSINLSYYGSYTAKQFGLQGISPMYYSTNLHQGNAGAKGNFTINENFMLYTDVDLNASDWYASVIPNGTNAASNTNRVGFIPEFGMKAGSGIFNCDLYGNYSLQYANGNADYLMHRGLLDYSMSFDLDSIKLSGEVGTAFTAERVIVPFALEFLYSNDFDINVKGGLRTKQSDIYELQKNYLVFSNYSASEQTEWYALVSGKFPICDFIENSAKLEFFRSEFGNGLLDVNYATMNVSNGLYETYKINGNFLNSEYAFNLFLKNSQLDLTWKAWWLDCPNSISPQNISLTYSYCAKDNFWGISTWGKIGFMGDRTILGDCIPDLGVSAFIRASKIIKVSLVMNDAIKLCSGTNRTLYGKYIKQSGYVSLLVSFYL